MSHPAATWPSHTTAVRPWRSARRGPRPDRETTTVVVSVPPRIAGARWSPDADTAALLDAATAAVVRLDSGHGDDLTPLATVLDRTEAVASSRIEHERASLDDVARALVGVRANPSATAMVQAAGALDGLVRAAGAGELSARTVLAAHERLMRHDPVDGRYAGRWRAVQNWIGGGATPRTADHVPPPPELVPALMADLFAFLDRDDLHPIAQAAIGHAQFESIHPFTDGNGRIGRALVAAVLRRRGVTARVTLPVATALVAERNRYFGHLARYRDGVVDEWVRDLAIAIGTVCDEATLTALLLAEADAARSAGPCAGGPHAAVGQALARDPFLTEDQLHLVLGGRDDLVETVVADLCRDGVLRPVTARRRDRAWVAVTAVDELAALGDRVRAAVTERAHRLVG